MCTLRANKTCFQGGDHNPPLARQLVKRCKEGNDVNMKRATVHIQGTKNAAESLGQFVGGGGCRFFVIQFLLTPDRSALNIKTVPLKIEPMPLLLRKFS